MKIFFSEAMIDDENFSLKIKKRVIGIKKITIFCDFLRFFDDFFEFLMIGIDFFMIFDDFLTLNRVDMIKELN